MKKIYKTPASKTVLVRPVSMLAASPFPDGFSMSPDGCQTEEDGFAD